MNKERTLFEDCLAPRTCALLACSIVILAFTTRQASAGVPWFDAGISQLEEWPDDGAEVAIPGNGSWSGTSIASLSDSAIEFESPAKALAFTLADGRDAAEEPLAVESRAKIYYFDDLPDAPQSGKGGIIVFAENYLPENAAYYGLAAVDDANEWVELSGATPPAEGVEAAIKIELAQGGGKVRYYADDKLLACDQSDEDGWIDIVPTVTKADKVLFSGHGAVASLSGVRCGEIENVSFKPGAPANATVASVACGGEEMPADETGAYQIPSGSLATVEYSPDVGYLISSRYSAIRQGEEDAASLPNTAKASDVISITEVMASNGETLATGNGKEGLDWIELHNSADFTVDLTGWYLSDNPDKKVAKWKKIAGDGAIASGEYKIIWAEKDYADWAKGEAWTPTGLGASGDPLFLADPRATKIKEASINIVTYGKAIKDVSSGFAGGELVYYRAPTPGAANGDECFTPPTAEVTFSEPHGWKNEPFELTLACDDNSGATIYYTLDGTSPTTESGQYSSPITIDKTTVVRAATLGENSILQQDTSATYLFLEDVLAQGSEAPTGFPASGAVNNQVMEYGMSASSVVADRERISRGFTNSISTVSLVIDPENLFNATTGIYVNARGDGREWERLAIVEIFSPTNAPDNIAASFPAGLRIRGGASRNPDHRKHSMRLFFRSEYGMNKLKHPLFGDEGADEFDKIDFRTSQNFSWANENNSNETFIHEVFSRDTQRDLGQPYNRSRYYHLFINGIYWGLYQTEERLDENYAESYAGGDADDYDVIRTSHGENLSYTTGAVEGSEAGWRRLWNIAVNEGFAGDNAGNYQMLIDEGLLNPTNLMAYMLVCHYAADSDCPVAGSWSTPSPNNIQAFCNREGTGEFAGFIFNKHDAEWSLVNSFYEFANAGYDTVLLGTETGKAGSVFLRYDHFNPAVLHYRLMQNEEYKAAFLDYARRELTVGALSDVESVARFRARMAEIDDAVACEAARWRDGKFSRDTWLAACDRCIDFLEGRGAELLALYENHDVYPTGSAEALTNAVAAAVLAENAAYGDLLWNAIATNETERANAANFAGTAAAMKTCLAANIPLVEEPDVQVDIPEFTISADGKVHIDGELKIGGESSEHTVNANIRLYSAATAKGLVEATDPVDLGHEFPVTDKTIDTGDEAQFYQIRLEL